MLEITALIVLAVCAGVFSAPLFRRMAVPGWLARARARRRLGVPVTAWLAAAALMALLWVIGERQGLLGWLLLLCWVAAPLLAARISLLWLPRDRPPVG
jgi:hypothetical protein